MSLTIRPDPRRPSGGYAQLDLPEAEVTGDSVLVAVFDAFSERFLGRQGWHATRGDFGPYPVERGEGRARIVVGPEIVNQIEEYAALRLHVGPRSYEVSWPDEVVPLPGAAVLGGLQVARAEAGPETAHLVGRRPGPEAAPAPGAAAVSVPVAEPAPPAEPAPAEPAPPAGPAPQPGPSRRGAILAGLLLVLALAAGLGWFLTSGEGEPTTVVAAPTPAPAPAPAPVGAPDPAADPCTAEALRALDGAPFSEALARFEGCQGAVRPETALALMENAADRGDPDALLLFGELYDSGAEDGLLERGVGLTLGDMPSSAAEYYARAQDAGAAAAAGRLAQLCRRLALAADTLSLAAHSEYCPQ